MVLSNIIILLYQRAAISIAFTKRKAKQSQKGYAGTAPKLSSVPVDVDVHRAPNTSQLGRWLAEMENCRKKEEKKYH